MTGLATPQGNRRRSERPWRRQPMSFARASLYGFFVLAAVSWGFIALGGDSGFADLFEGRTWDNAGRFLESIIGVNSDSPPAYAQPSRWLETGKLAANTLAMSLLAIGMAGAGAFVTLLMAARNVSDGSLGGGRPPRARQPTMRPGPPTPSRGRSRSWCWP